MRATILNQKFHLGGKQSLNETTTTNHHSKPNQKPTENDFSTATPVSPRQSQKKLVNKTERELIQKTSSRQKKKLQSLDVRIFYGKYNLK